MHRLLPLMHFELRRQTLGRRPSAVRLAAVGGLGLLYGSVLASKVFSPWGTAVGAGGDLLAAAAWLNYALVIVTALSLLATLVSDERESGTLPLLTAAGVSPASLLCGKLLSVLTLTGLMLLTQAPLLAAPVFFGGVTYAQAAAVAGLLASMLFLWSGIGLLISTAAPTNLWATLTVAVLLIVVEGSAPLGQWASQWASIPPMWVAPAERLAGWDMLASGQGLRDVLRGSATSDPLALVVRNVSVGGAAAAAALALGQVWIPRSFRPRRTRRLAGARRTRRWRGDPLAGKEFRGLLGGGFGLALRTLLIAGAAAVVAWLARAAGGTDRSVRDVTLLAVAAIALVDWWRLSAGLLGKEVEGNTLPTLVLTGSGPLEIVWRKAAGVLTALLPAAVVAALVITWAGNWGRVRDAMPSLAAGGGAVLLLLSLTLLFSMRSPRLGWAIAATVCVFATAVAAPLGVMLVFLLGGDADRERSVASAAAYFLLAAAVFVHGLTLANVSRAAAR